MSTTSTATADAQHTTVSGDADSLFVNGILLSANASKQERWLASEHPDVLRRINNQHDDYDASRADIIDHIARKLAVRAKENGESITLPDATTDEFVVTQHAEDDDHDRFVPDENGATSQNCPECGSDMHSQVLQTRSADEAGTEIYKCSDPTCSHTERRND